MCIRDRNYPNPFNGSTRIEFSLPNSQFVSLRVFNALGQEVALLVNDILPAGVHSVSFDAAGLPTGVYTCRISAGSYVQTRKLILMK